MIALVILEPNSNYVKTFGLIAVVALRETTDIISRSIYCDEKDPILNVYRVFYSGCFE